MARDVKPLVQSLDVLSVDLKEPTLLEKSRVIPVWSRVELWATFFRHTVRGQGGQAVGPVSRHSIVGLERTHELEKSRGIRVLWSVN